MDSQKQQFGRTEVIVILNRLREQAVHALLRHREDAVKLGAHNRNACHRCSYWEGKEEGLRQAMIHFGGKRG